VNRVLSLIILCVFIAGFVVPGQALCKVVAKRKTAAAKPAVRHLSVPEIEQSGLYRVMDAYMYRMCIQEVTFFLALHRCYFQDKRLDRGDTLAVSKQVIRSLLARAAARSNETALIQSPVTNIDSMMIFRYRGKRPIPGACNIIVFARSDAYEIPKTGAKIQVPAVIKGTVYGRQGGQTSISIFTKGVKLILPGYAKVLSMGMITDMDIRFADLYPSGSGFEARLMYGTNEKEISKRGWSLNVTECNKIRPYAK
jgi:hypothetical protein